ncbi:MAG: helix-turn-helix transcriptional regulator [Candidatus Acidiferrales bacterium]
MTSDQLKTARMNRGWSQQRAAKRLGVTQAYLSMLESGRRSAEPLSRKLMQVYGLSPATLPVHEVRENLTPDRLARELAGLGYPGFAHLRGRASTPNPAEYLLSALSQSNLEARVAEGLPWVVLRYPDMPLEWLVRESRARLLQNRLGFAVTLAKRAAARDDLEPLERTLADGKLEKEDSFCEELSEVGCRWLRTHSSDEARQWNLLSDLRPDAVRYAA